MHERGTTRTLIKYMAAGGDDGVMMYVVTCCQQSKYLEHANVLDHSADQVHELCVELRRRYKGMGALQHIVLNK